MQPEVRASAKASSPEAPPDHTIQNHETTYFWHGEHDAEVCRLYVRTKYPNSKARVVHILPTHRLHDRSHVICLVRKKPTPLETYTIELGRRHAVQIDPATKLGEVVEAPPVAAKPFIVGGNEYEDGALNAGAYIDALSPGFTPNACHYRQDDGKAHLYAS